MKTDMLFFTENPYYMKMIHYKGSISTFKHILILTGISIAFLVSTAAIGAIFNGCQENEILRRHHYYDYLIVYILALVMSLYAYKRYSSPIKKEKKSYNWKRIIADIKEIGIFEVRVIRDGMSYYPAIIATYLINGTSYECRTYSFYEYVYNETLDPTLSSKYHSMNKTFEEWVINKKIEIYYNPENPRESVIRRNPKNGHTRYHKIMSNISLGMIFLSIFNIVCWTT